MRVNHDMEELDNHRDIIAGTALIRWKSYGDYNAVGNIENKNRPRNIRHHLA
jgi:hypothetical protein